MWADFVPSSLSIFRSANPTLFGNSRSAGAGGSGLALAVEPGWQTGIQTQTKGQNQPTGYFYDQALVMNSSAGVGGMASSE